MYCCHREYGKITELKNSKGNFDTPGILSSQAIEKVKWWERSILDAFCVIKSNPEIIQAPTVGMFMAIISI